MEGNDTFYVLSTNPTVETSLYGGMGSDRVEVGAPRRAGAVRRPAGPHRARAALGGELGRPQPRSGAASRSTASPPRSRTTTHPRSRWCPVGGSLVLREATSNVGQLRGPSDVQVEHAGRGHPLGAVRPVVDQPLAVRAALAGRRPLVHLGHAGLRGRLDHRAAGLRQGRLRQLLRGPAAGAAADPGGRAGSAAPAPRPARCSRRPARSAPSRPTRSSAARSSSPAAPAPARPAPSSPAPPTR